MVRILNSVIDYVIIRKSQCFDSHYYLEDNPDVKARGSDPLWHFVRFGWREGRSPSADFSTNFYLNQYPDVAEVGINPLVHYIRFGEKEGRETNGLAEVRSLSKIVELSKKDVEQLLDFSSIYRELTPLSTTEVTDIVICVGQHPTNFIECISSIRKFTDSRKYKLHLIAHERDVNKLQVLGDSVGQIHTHCLENFIFSKANNIVLSFSQNDVVLLNDDTEVTTGWLELLREASKGIALTGAHTDPHCSGNPDMWGEGGIVVTDNPINMFCAFIPHRLRELIGVLDEGFHYYGGEDVDYSIRAREAGVPLVISAAYVRHKDNQSYGKTKSRLIVESERLLIEKHRIGSPYTLTAVHPLVSVIMTTYNRQSLLEEAIASVFLSEYPLFEFIIVDDFSDDNTLNKLLELQSEHSNFILARPPRNLGLAGARNLALSIASGKFVYFTDDDDTVLPNRISAPLNLLVRNPVLDAVYCDFNSINNLGEVTSHQGQKFNLDEYLNRQFTIGSGILFGRTELFRKVPFDGTYNRALDFDWVFRVVRQGYKIEHCPVIVMNYNRTGFVDQHLSGNIESFRLHTHIVEREKLLKGLRRPPQK